MTPYYSQAGITIYHGDNRDILPQLSGIDAVLTDPPYGLRFMGKDWDHLVPGKHFWELILNALKPGAHLMAFGGTRTHHRLMCAIEDAGFEIRDCLMWLYGSGFPKSHDVSKAIDKAAGAKREVTGKGTHGKGSYSQGMIKESGYRPYVAGLPSENNGGVHDITSPATDSAKQWSGWGTALKPAWEPIILAMIPIEGTFAENVQKYGTGAMNIDGGRIPANGETPKGSGNRDGRGNSYQLKDWVSHNGGNVTPPNGRWPANVILDEEAGKMVDEQTGILPQGGAQRGSIIKSKGGGYNSDVGMVEKQSAIVGEQPGGASRFFYCAKASTSERGEDNNHPTVKPVSLLKYLAKLICPPHGVILDPFMGSGSTLCAARDLGRKAIGIEIQKEYCEIAAKRLFQAQEDLALEVA